MTAAPADAANATANVTMVAASAVRILRRIMIALLSMRLQGLRSDRLWAAPALSTVLDALWMREEAVTSEWDNLSVVAKARLEEVEADEKLIFSRLMNQATPDERKALERMMAGARAYVLALDEEAKAEAK
jgi:hypothetical protein